MECMFINCQDLQSCVETDFPIGTELSSIEKEREAHISFAEARRRIYIGRESYFKYIDNYMDAETNTPLVILGESGDLFVLVTKWLF